MTNPLPNSQHAFPPNEQQAAQTPPRLWNPGAAASWSLFFSPIFGALLQMKNWEALGEHERARKSKQWAMGSAVVFVALVLFGLVAPESKLVDGLSRLFNLVLLISWYYANGKYQQTYVAARFGKTYTKRGWSKPIGLAVAAAIAFLLTAGIIGFLIGIASAAVE